MTPEFNEWWDSDRLTQTNQFAEDTPAYWALEGWQACSASEQSKVALLREALIEATAALEWRWETVANRASPVHESSIDSAYQKAKAALAATAAATMTAIEVNTSSRVAA